jgi:hypothetical protein
MNQFKAEEKDRAVHLPLLNFALISVKLGVLQFARKLDIAKTRFQKAPRSTMYISHMQREARILIQTRHLHA